MRCYKCLLALLAVLATHSADARAIPDGLSRARRLQGSPNCPEGCVVGACVQDGTYGGYRCTACLGSLTVRSIDGQCGCRAGFYYSNINTCSACSKGTYCPGGAVTAGTQPQQIACPDGMTTPGIRSSSVQQCVNLPGYFYISTSNSTSAPIAALCPADTWSIGMRKQRQCVPCPPGYTTGGVEGSISPSACFIPAGFFTPSAGVVAPCPRGTWKSETGGNSSCTPCARGVTTAAEGATSQEACSVVLPGVYASAMNGSTVTSTRSCPQRFYCPGGAPSSPFDPAAPAALSPAELTIKACPDGLWTQGLGAASSDECLTPPGFYTAGGNTSRCPPGEFRSEWLPADQAASCQSCGAGVFSSPTDQLTAIDPATEVTSQIPVMTESSGCYIKPGQGLYRVDINGKRTWRAKNCDTNSYGVSKIMYGRLPMACRDCPAGMVTSTDKVNYPRSSSFYVDNGDGTGGFIDPKACVTQAGYGYNSRQASPCGLGYYNDKDTWSTCSKCPYGTTTADVGAGVTLSDCKLAAGYGFQDNAIVRCPIGTYNDVVRNDTSSPCTPCPASTTTLQEGADSAEDCSVCLPGFGGPGCTTLCGGWGESASYGEAGRPKDSACTACPASQTGYSFNWNLTNDAFAPAPVARLGAQNPFDCLAEFSQTVDGAWYLPFTGSNNSVVSTPGVASFAACASLCTADCQFFTYDYVAKTCTVRRVDVPVLEGAPFIAFKTEISGDVGAASIRTKSNVAKSQKTRTQTTVTGQALSSGSYVFYQDAGAQFVGIQSPAPGAASFKDLQDCLLACDVDNSCTAVVVESTVAVAARPQTCKLIKGDSRVGIFKRSMTRADASRLNMPAGLLQ